ncbi:hypothetical protein ONO86_00679 [Micromonospora noduli]|nr:hypothetical protein ONO86_00679 [Micromonospora noduli]
MSARSTSSDTSVKKTIGSLHAATACTARTRSRRPASGPAMTSFARIAIVINRWYVSPRPTSAMS